jgi:anti-sigma regulatory factor (Ser/Thr protein kinase)
VEHGTLTAAALLREADAHLEAATAALDAPVPRTDTARSRVAHARQALGRLRAHVDTAPAAPEGTDPLALVRRLDLPAQRASARRARAFAGETCEHWSLPVPVRSAAVDVASELVSNAAAHGSGTVVLALERGAGNLLVRVWDDGPGLPRVLPYRPGLSEKGLGLRLVKQLSSHWGTAAEDGGKWVWARVTIPEADDA